MKIMFVNVDAALCTYRMQHSELALKYRGDGVVERDARYLTDLDPVSCGLLLKICKRCDVRIVPILDSTIDNVYELFVARLETYCPELVQYIVNPSIRRENDFKPNYGETFADVLIDIWLKRYSRHLGVEEYIIISDVVGRSDKHVGHYLRCDNYDGFGFKQYVKCLHRFTNSEHVFVEGLGTIDKNGYVIVKNIEYHRSE